MKKKKNVSLMIFFIGIIVALLVLLIVIRYYSEKTSLPAAGPEGTVIDEESSRVGIEEPTEEAIVKVSVGPKAYEDVEFTDKFFVADIINYYFCNAWNEQDVSLCNNIPDINLHDFVVQEKNNCKIYYYQSKAYMEKNRQVCAASPEKETCFNRYDPLESDIERGNTAGILDKIDKGTDSMDANYEAKAYVLQDNSFCEDFSSLCKESPMCKFKTNNCIIFSSSPGSLECEKYLP